MPITRYTTTTCLSVCCQTRKLLHTSIFMHTSRHPLTKIPQPHYFKISLRDIPSISRRLHLADMSPAHEQSLTSAPATLAIFHHILAPFRKCFLRSYPGFIYIQTNLFILTKRRPFDPPKGRRSSIFARRSEGRGRCWRGTLMSAHAYKR